jgi:hypothetical protein
MDTYTIEETNKFYDPQMFIDIRWAHKVSCEMFARMKRAHIAPLPLKRAACAFALNKR